MAVSYYVCSVAMVTHSGNCYHDNCILILSIMHNTKQVRQHNDTNVQSICKNNFLETQGKVHILRAQKSLIGLF